MKKKAGVLLLYSFLATVGLLFAMGALIIYISIAIFDFIAFLALLGIAGSSLSLDWLKRKRHQPVKKLAH